MNNDVKILFDAVNCIYGTFHSMEKDKGQTSEFVYIYYYPFNQFFGKPHKYAQPVKRSWVHTFTPVKNGQAGIPQDIVFIHDPESSLGLASYLRSKNDRLIEDLTAKNKEQYQQIGVLKQKLLAATGGANMQLAEARKVVDTKKNETDILQQNGLNTRWGSFRQD